MAAYDSLFSLVVRGVRPRRGLGVGACSAFVASLVVVRRRVGRALSSVVGCGIVAAPVVVRRVRVVRRSLVAGASALVVGAAASALGTGLTAPAVIVGPSLAMLASG